MARLLPLNAGFLLKSKVAFRFQKLLDAFFIRGHAQSKMINASIIAGAARRDGRLTLSIYLRRRI